MRVFPVFMLGFALVIASLIIADEAYQYAISGFLVGLYAGVGITSALLEATGQRR